MSRRASVFARQNPGKRRVRFPDEVVFEESIKESDGHAIMTMLRRVSVDIDVDRINMAGMTALHQAVLDDNLVVVRLLLHHGAGLNKKDEDSWTPLHAAAANGHHQIAEFLLSQGASRDVLTDDGETAIDLTDPEDFQMMAILRRTEVSVERDRRLSLGPEAHKEPLWLRRESLASRRHSAFAPRRDSALGQLGMRKESHAQEGALRPPTEGLGGILRKPSEGLAARRTSVVAGERRSSGILANLHQEESLLRDTFSVLRARKGSMYPRGPQVLEEYDEDNEEEAEEGEVEVTSSSEVKIEKSIVRVESAARKASEEECDVAEALATWKRRREERLER